jgi:hypothetical protein
MVESFLVQFLLLKTLLFHLKSLLGLLLPLLEGVMLLKEQLKVGYGRVEGERSRGSGHVQMERGRGSKGGGGWRRKR